MSDAAELNTLPDDTLIVASGDYLTGGTFTDCWARPVPEFIAGHTDTRLWEVLVFGATAPKSLTDSARITKWRVLYAAHATPQDAYPVSASVHVAPTSDLIKHDTSSDDCPCGPRTESVTRDDGSTGWVVVHHSLDGREAR